ncbi:MAG: SusC/RagA family TonB-linked outer membrane protein, partial [Bacteroidetes bacterium]|nr:SusC/RagA family TonB-linked outer membrane protein [Bacteroidota bacterium]
VPLNQKQYIGRLTPDVFGGITNKFSYRNFSLSANINYKFGYYFLRSSVNYGNLFSGWQGNVDFVKRWQNPGDNTTVPSMPSASGLDPNRDRFYNNSAVLATSGNNIRLQDLVISYNLDQHNWKRLPFKHLQFLIDANNLGILWRANKYGIDPDYQLTGFVPPKTFSFGIKGSF